MFRLLQNILIVIRRTVFAGIFNAFQYVSMATRLLQSLVRAPAVLYVAFGINIFISKQSVQHMTVVRCKIKIAVFPLARPTLFQTPDSAIFFISKNAK